MPLEDSEAKIKEYLKNAISKSGFPLEVHVSTILDKNQRFNTLLSFSTILRH